MLLIKQRILTVDAQPTIALPKRAVTTDHIIPIKLISATRFIKLKLYLPTQIFFHFLTRPTWKNINIYSFFFRNIFKTNNWCT